MTKLTRRTVVQAVVESVLGTDPGSGYTALLTNVGAEITPSGNTIVRETLRDTMSPRGHIVTLKEYGLTLPFELRGAGVTGANLDTPDLDVLLKAAAMQRSDGRYCVLTGVTGTFTIGETVTNDTAANTLGTVALFDAGAGVLLIRDLQNAPADSNAISGDTSGASATVSSSADAMCYRPVSDPANIDSATVHFYSDGIRKIATGVRGSFSLELASGALGAVQWTAQGVYATPTDTSNPTGLTYNDTDPEEVKSASVILGSHTLTDVAVRQLSVDLANAVTQRQDIQQANGIRSHEITGRDPTGTLVLDQDTIANLDPFTDWEAGTQIVLAVGFGSAAGRRIHVIHPAAQIESIGVQDADGVAGYSLGYRATGTDDELMLFYS